MKENSPKIVAIIQARMGSSRLPGKVLKDLAGKAMLAHVIERSQKAKVIDAVMVATTVNEQDLPIVAYCRDAGVAVFQGDEFDVLDRYYQAAKTANADIIVRLTADCPLMDATLIDELVAAFLESGVDFAANRLPPPWKRTYPIGLDIEVVSFANLEKAWQLAEAKFEREHVMPYFYDEPGRFKTLLMHYIEDLGDKRWTVDTPQDLEMLQSVFAHFSDQPNFGWLDVYQWLKEHPEIEAINAEIGHKHVKEVDQRFEGAEK